MSMPDRKRVSLACTSCRKRKRRCDGKKPLCGLCEKQNRQCEYTHHLEKRKPPTKCYIHALHSRIALLEAQLEFRSHRDKNDSLMDHSLSSESQSPQSPQVENTSSSSSQGSPPVIAPLGLESRFTSAYGHLSLLKNIHTASNVNFEGIGLINGALYIEGSAANLTPSLQAELLEEFWPWNNTWPILIHESLFREDLSVNGAKGYCTPPLVASILALSIHNTDIKGLESKIPNSTEAKKELLDYSKAFIVEQMESPSLSLILIAGIISQIDHLIENIASASHYIGIAVRQAMTLGLHMPSSNTSLPPVESIELREARSIAWAGVWMLEKLHITRILGQPSIVGELDTLPITVPILPMVEYAVLPASTESTVTTRLTSYCMSNFQLSCELVRMVTPALDMIYSISAHYSVEEKENKATQLHVAMSEFYNNLPGPLRLPPAGVKQLPAHVYQSSLLYQTLKIMLHRPFIRGIPSMESLHSNQDPHLVHIQSATFSAMRVSYIISSFRKFYPLQRLFPMAVESLIIASHIHLINSKSTDEKLATRANNLYRLNAHFLDLMCPPGLDRTCAMDVLESLGREFGKHKPQSTHNENGTLPARGVPVLDKAWGISIQKPVAVAAITGKHTAVELDNSDAPLDLTLNEASYFDWLDLPIHEHLLFNGAFGDSLWEGYY